MEKYESHNLLITTESKNQYFTARNKPQVLLLHPITAFLIRLRKKNELNQWRTAFPAAPSVVMELMNP